MEVLVQTHNLMKQYGQHKVVNNVNLSVKKGEIYGLIGRNGAGKTTVLRLISGLTKSTGGVIRFSPRAMSQVEELVHISDKCREECLASVALVQHGSKRNEGKIPRCLRWGGWPGQNSRNTIYTQNHVGILIESPGIYPNMSAKDNVKLKCLAMGISGRGYIAELLYADQQHSLYYGSRTFNCLQNSKYFLHPC